LIRSKKEVEFDLAGHAHIKIYSTMSISKNIIFDFGGKVVVETTESSIFICMKIKINFPVLTLVMFSFLFFVELNAQNIYQVSHKEAGISLGSSLLMVLGGEAIEYRRGDLTIADLDNIDPSSIIGFDRGVIDYYSDKASSDSDILKNGIIVVPFSLFLGAQARANTREILLMYCEVGAINIGLTKFVKGAAGRYRPFAYNPDVDLSIKLQPTTRRSFFSGHVSHVASLSFFTAAVFEDLYPDSNMRYVVWGGALSAPALTAYLRVKGGRHFISDVVVGYAVGAAVGFLVPKFHKHTRDNNIEIIGAEGGLGLIWTF